MVTPLPIIPATPMVTDWITAISSLIYTIITGILVFIFIDWQANTTLKN